MVNLQPATADSLVFRRVVTPYPPGVEVELGDGRRGVVVSVPQADLTRPLVRVGWERGGREVAPYEVDTANEPELEVSCVTSAICPSLSHGTRCCFMLSHVCTVL